MFEKLYNRSSRFYLSGIILLAAVVRIARALIDHEIKQDAVLYMNQARVWSEFGADAASQLHTMIPPFWPWILSVGQDLGVSPEITAKSLGILLGVTVVISVYVMCSAVFKEKSYALIGALLIAVHPYLIRLSTEMLRDTVYVPLVAAALAFAMSAAVSHRWWKWLCFGVICGIAVMTRREGGEILIFLGAWSVVELIQKRAEFKNTVKRVVQANVLAYGVMLLIAYPVQCAMAKTHTTWRIIPWGIEMNLRQLFSISEDELFNKVQEK